MESQSTQESANIATQKINTLSGAIRDAKDALVCGITTQQQGGEPKTVYAVGGYDARKLLEEVIVDAATKMKGLIASL